MSHRKPTTLQRKFGHAVACRRCGISDRLEWHHITYTPESVVPLCHWCHLRITQRNKRAAKRIRRKLNNAERQEIWRDFLKRSK